MSKTIVVLKNNKLFLKFLIKEKPITVGRLESCDVVINDGIISRTHFMVWLYENKIKVRDLESNNGISVNEGTITGEEVFAEKWAIGNFTFMNEQLYKKLVITDKRDDNKSGIDSINYKKMPDLFMRLTETYYGKFVKEMKNYSVKDEKDAVNYLEKLYEDDGDIISEYGIEKSELSKSILNEIFHYGVITPLINDDSVTEIMVNGKDYIFFEKKGLINRFEGKFYSNDSVKRIIDRIVFNTGRRIDESSPFVDTRLIDGSRFNAIIPPVSLNGPTMTIRKFSNKKLLIDDLIKFGSISKEMSEFLSLAVKYRKNIIISGGTGTGKTTFLGVVSSFIGDNERIITIEDAAELQLSQKHVVSLEARPPNIEGKGAISIRDLVKNSLRMRPDRIIIGECRGGEALDMLQAMNTGHDGSLTTLHANSPRDAVSRLETMVLMSGIELPHKAIIEQITSAVDVIIQLTRFSDGTRKVTSITEVEGIEGDVIILKELYKFVRERRDNNGKIIGNFVSSGFMSSLYSHLKEIKEMQ